MPRESSATVPAGIVSGAGDEQVEHGGRERALVEHGRAARHQRPLELRHATHGTPAFHTVGPRFRLVVDLAWFV